MQLRPGLVLPLGRRRLSPGRVLPLGRRRLSSFALTPDGHPLVDVSPLLPGGGDAAAQEVSGRAIGDALRERGYFYAQNVSVLPPEYIASVYDFSRRAHMLPTEVKRQFQNRGGILGTGRGCYSGPDVGEGELEYEPGSVSTVHAWDYSRARELTYGAEDEASRYPSAAVLSPPYAEFLDGLYERQNVLARGLLRGLARACQLPPETLLEWFDGSAGGGDYGTIRLLSYPGAADAPAAASRGISAHTDFEFFTLMHQDAPGLQFLPPTSKPREWIDAPVRPGEVRTSPRPRPTSPDLAWCRPTSPDLHAVRRHRGRHARTAHQRRLRGHPCRKQAPPTHASGRPPKRPACPVCWAVRASGRPWRVAWHCEGLQEGSLAESPGPCFPT